MKSATALPTAPAVPWTGRPAADGVNRISQWYGHELRNYLNVLELKSTVLGELVSDAQTSAIVRRMRAELTELDVTVKALLIRFESPRPVVVAAADLLQLWKHQVMGLVRPGRSINWQAARESSPLTVDARAVATVLCELTLAASQRAAGVPLGAAVQISAAGAVVVSLREPANETPLPAGLLEESGRFIRTHGGLLEH